MTELKHPVGRFAWERALRELDLKTTTKAVGLMLATYANATGGNAHPGVDRLAHDLRMKPRAVYNHLAVLQQVGVITKVFSGSSAGRRKLADEYALTLPPDVLRRVNHLHRRAGDQSEDLHGGAGDAGPITCTVTTDHLHAGTDHLHVDDKNTCTVVHPTRTCTKDVDHTSPTPPSTDLSSRRPREAAVPHAFPFGADECNQCPLPAGNAIHTNHRAAS